MGNTTKRMLIELGDGEGTEAFAWPCGANGRSIKMTNNLGEETVLDCADPLDGDVVVTRWLESQDTTISIDGRVAREFFAEWRDWADTGATRNIRVKIDESLANGGGYWILPAIIGEFDMGQEGKASVTFTAAISGAGKRVWTPAGA